MKRSSTLFLQAVLILIAFGALAFLLWEPHLEGRNVNATLFQIYFKDPFLLYVYAASVAFFTAIFQGIKLLGYIRRNQTFSQEAVKTLRITKFCALILTVCIVGAEGYIFTIQRSVEEDIAGGVMLGLVLIFLSVVVATAAAIFERTLQSAVDLKSENDLTV